ncbi:hypothetical protein N5094_07135 [Shewanella putrefaciens]|uniref:hypothetical protein n=1 Tax=Gammaproteobacteria TaxID=1236 RepID=UPI0011DA1135|nr:MULTISPECIES: hypothetical protein [Gammaproteobacteria]TXY62611.1 hypothetical protein FXE88_08410 [Vibrio cholerae]UXK09970.1 hypothetical protein N5094_07135 [Shewanella putrefaciens]GHX20455.1 hypothetical protein VCSRO107_1084 [Vibrio cholerae]GHX35653.1 hypothetical protein VCSRO108_1329 [Vibrio cholerae]
MSNSEVTLSELNSSLERLLSGNPERTKPDGRISIKRINDEAGLSRGAIYYYKDFIETAKKAIEKHKSDKVEGADSVTALTPEQKLKQQMDKEKRLKEDYRDQARGLEGLNDALVIQNVSLAFRCMELQHELELVTQGRLVSIRDK